ncbi:MAG TPA: hypothetical protein DDW91_16230 [Shewanella frigidimarina]|nr:hypothetical protein [Shewanella frigidimarina]
MNDFNVESTLLLFTTDAVIDDSSTGHQFHGQAGIRDYIERYFIEYNTVTCFLSSESLGNSCARVRVDFTGDFGHEIGLLEITINANGLIVHIDANLVYLPIIYPV